MRRDQVTEEGIVALVDRFYDKVRADATLGPIFEEAIAGDWGPHLAKMYDFWSSIMLTTGRYKGRPLPAHVRLPIEPQHFGRWLELFTETTEELFEPDVAHAFQVKAHQIANSFLTALETVKQFPSMAR